MSAIHEKKRLKICEVIFTNVTFKFNENVYTSGYHFIGFMHKFISYPSTMQTFEFSKSETKNRGPIEGRSSDGLMVNFGA